MPEFPATTDVAACITGPLAPECGSSPIGPPADGELARQALLRQRADWESGQRVTVEEILARNPRLAGDPEIVVDLIFHEYLLRERGGESPTADTFAARFPEQAVALRKQIAFHDALQERSVEAPQRLDAVSQPSPDEFVISEAAQRGVLPGYEMLEEIGVGGTGVLYRARQTATDRIVAIKVLSAGTYAAEGQRGRFRAEAALIARLQHPHIVQIYEAGEQQGCPYLVLEFMGGGSLRDRLHGIPQAPRPAARFLEVVARAVEAAHVAGVVHRDLTPGNILFSGDASISNNSAGLDVGQPKISDFGLAKALDAEAGENADHRTMTGDVIGTPAYMSPEQAAGRTNSIGPPADIYALGAILYELLTGRPPLRGVTAVETLQRIVNSEPIAPSRLQPGLPADLETICLKCLQKEPAQRYGTAADLAEDLRRYLGGETILARPVSRLVKSVRWCRRKPLLATLAGLVLLLVVIVVAGSVGAALRLNQAALDRLAEAKLAEARVHRLDNQLGRRDRSLSALAEAAQIHATPELRDEAIASLTLFDLKFDHYGPPAAGLIDISADLKRYAHQSNDGAIVVSHVADDAEICRFPNARPVSGGLFSPDGRHLACRWLNDPKIQLWFVGTAEPRLVLAEECDLLWGMGAVNFSGDGSTIAIGRRDGSVVINRLDDGVRGLTFRVPPPIRHLAFRPQSSQLALALESGVQVRDARDGRLLIQLDNAATSDFLSWHPSGRYLVISDSAGVLSLWEPDQLRRVNVMPGRNPGGVATAFDRTGAMLFAAGRDGSLRVWDPHWGRPLYSTYGSDKYFLQFTADRRFWLGDVENGRTRFWEFPEAPVYRRLSSTTDFDLGQIHAMAVSPAGSGRGKLLAAAMENGVGFWDVRTGRSLAHLRIGKNVDITFDDAGNLLTADSSGVQFWPVRDGSPDNSTLTIGPPEYLPQIGLMMQMSCSANGRVIGFARSIGGAMVVDRDHSQAPLALVPQGQLTSIAVTPDGQFAATASANGGPVQIWDAHSGKLASELTTKSSRVAFSADGRHMLTCTGDLELWSVGDWRLLWKEPGKSFSARAFSLEGRFVAAAATTGQITVYSVADGRVVARLEDPYPWGITALAFAPDGQSLVGVYRDVFQISVWDLKSITLSLAQMGLRGDLTDSSSHEGVGWTAPLTVAVRLKDAPVEWEEELEKIDKDLVSQPGNVALLFRKGVRLAKQGRDAEAHDAFAAALHSGPKLVVAVELGACDIRLGHWPEGIAVFERALADPTLSATQAAGLCNQVAWYLNLAPPEFRDSRKALEFAHRALELDPEGFRFLTILGTALFRRGELPLAIETLRISLRNSALPNFDLYVLALCHQARGDHSGAADFVSRADYLFGLQAETLDPQRRAELEGLREEYLRGLPPSPP